MSSIAFADTGLYRSPVAGRCVSFPFTGRNAVQVEQISRIALAARIAASRYPAALARGTARHWPSWHRDYVAPMD